MVGRHTAAVEPRTGPRSSISTRSAPEEVQRDAEPDCPFFIAPPAIAAPEPIQGGRDDIRAQRGHSAPARRGVPGWDPESGSCRNDQVKVAATIGMTSVFGFVYETPTQLFMSA